MFYFACLLLSTFPLCLSLRILYFRFLSFLCAFYFLSCCLLSFSCDFLYLSSNFSFCFYLFLCLLLSFLAFFYFHSLPVLCYITLPLLFILLHNCVCVFFIIIITIIIIIIILFFFSVFSTFQCFACLFCIFFYFFFLFYFSYFALFSILFNYLVLILDFNYCKFYLLFIFPINLLFLPILSYCFVY